MPDGRGLHLTERTVFYEESGSLVYFMMNERGAEGREAIIEALRNYYDNYSSRSGWERLGFKTAEELAREFTRFLQGLLE